MTELTTGLGRVIHRHVQTLVEDALLDTRVVLVNGARQAGKSTLTSLMAQDRPGSLFRSLDRPAFLDAARDDPTSFVEHDDLLVIDEIQRAPELLLPIKHRVDTTPLPGRFLLTGSARVLGLKALPDALPGRMETIELWPFSQGEIEGNRDSFVDAIFGLADRPPPRVAGTSRRDLAARIVQGGFPEAVARRDSRRRRRFHANYVHTLIDRDIRDLSGIERGADLNRLLQLVAARTGQLLVARALSSDLTISARTTLRYLDLCEEIFLIKRIPAWSSNLGKRAISTPKVAFVDSGVAAYLLSQDEKRLANIEGPLGPLLEGFVLMELARQIEWAEEEVRLYHYRTKDNVEVDAVLETMDGRIAGVEIKASATVRSSDFQGLRMLARRAGDAFSAGVVLYSGSESLSFGERLRALPVSALWELT
jgi:predicted AAA+ superfamily ATPase